MPEKLVLVSKKDLVIEWFNPGKKGGQNSNKHNNCCRLTHPASGACGQGTRHRESKQNQRDAFKALTEHAKFKLWLTRRLYELRTNETTEQRVDRLLAPHNLVVEGIDEYGQWVQLEI